MFDEMNAEDCRTGLRRRGVCVIIPTFNNAGTVADVVTRAQRFCSDIIVVADGCTDGTPELLASLPQPPDTLVLPRNTGKGNALREGFRHAREAGFAYAITLDADGQHFPEDIPLFLEAGRLHPDSIIVGSREGLDMADRSASSRFANSFSNFWFFCQTFIPLKDTQTGYRLYPLDRLHGLNLLTSRYEAELELLVYAAWSGTGIVSRDVRVYYPPRWERVSHFRPVRDFARISLLNTVLCLLALVYGLPRTLLRFLCGALKSLTIFLFYALSMLLFLTPGLFVWLKVSDIAEQTAECTAESASEKTKEQLHRFICASARFALRLLGIAGNPCTVAESARNGQPSREYASASHPLKAVGDASGSRLRGKSGDLPELRRLDSGSSPAVIVCNHQSHLDLLPLLALTPKLVILTADWVWHNPLYGFIIRQADYLPASRGIEQIAPKLRELTDKGYSIAIFPEGTRSPDGRIGRFHQGAFFLADRLGLDILPLVLYGTGMALPKHGRILRRRPLRVEIDTRISPEEMSREGESLKERASYMRGYFARRQSEIADRVESGPHRARRRGRRGNGKGVNELNNLRNAYF